MDWLAPTCASATALATAAITPAVLRRLPEPTPVPGEPKPPYATLATPGFVLGVAAATLASTLVVFWTTPPAVWGVWTPLAALGALAVAIDARQLYLPRRLAQVTAALMAVGLAVATGVTRDPWLPMGALAGAAGLGLAFWLMWRLRSPIGFGDVRLMVLVGAASGLGGLDSVLWSALLGSVVGLGWGLAYRVTRGPGAPFPYGPGLWAGPFLALALSAWPTPG